MAVWDALNQIVEIEGEIKFIFVLDEWDFIFHRDFVTAADKAEIGRIEVLREAL